MGLAGFLGGVGSPAQPWHASWPDLAEVNSDAGPNPSLQAQSRPLALSVSTMKAPRAALVLAIVAAASIAAIFFWARSTGEELSEPDGKAQTGSLTSAPKPDGTPAASSTTSAEMQKRIALLEESVMALRSKASAGKGESAPALGALENSVKALEQRLTALEKSSRLAGLEAAVRGLQLAVSGVNLEKASAERQALFAAPEGYLKADEYAAAGQHAIAGEGYLTFLQNHPEHADARDVMKKARDSFLKAGYKDKAFWVHEEMMKTFHEHQSADLWDQAVLEK